MFEVAFYIESCKESNFVFKGIKYNDKQNRKGFAELCFFFFKKIGLGAGKKREYNS